MLPYVILATGLLAPSVFRRVQSHQQMNRRIRKYRIASITSNQNSTPSSIICKRSRKIIDCLEFKEKEASCVFQLINTGSYYISICRSRKSWGVADYKKLHHNLLHEECQQEERVFYANIDTSATPYVWFKIVPAKLYHDKRTISAYAMVDKGASVTLDYDKILNDLDLEGSANDLTLYNGLEIKPPPTHHKLWIYRAAELKNTLCWEMCA